MVIAGTSHDDSWIALAYLIFLRFAQFVNEIFLKIHIFAEKGGFQARDDLNSTD